MGINFSRLGFGGLGGEDHEVGTSLSSVICSLTVGNGVGRPLSRRVVSYFEGLTKVTGGLGRLTRRTRVTNCRSITTISELLSRGVSRILGGLDRLEWR